MSNDGFPPPLHWFSAGNSAFAPVDPRKGKSALAPVDPYSAWAAAAPIDPLSAWARAAPVDPYAHSAAAAPVDPKRLSRSAFPTPAPSPRGGIDPSWVYSGNDALLAQAIRRSTSKVSRPPDELLSEQEYRAAQSGQQVKGTHLWRWAPEFRVKTIATELLSRTHVVGAAIWWSRPQLIKDKLRFSSWPLFSLDNMPAVDMKDQIDKVARAAIEREDRMPEILAQSNGFWPFFENLLDFPLSSAPAVAELMAIGDQWLIHELMALKHACHWKRPVQESSLVMPTIATPGHGSMPSGHATVAAFQAELLRELMYTRASLRSQQLDRLARRISFNRVVGGVHFPVDNLVGYRLGTQMAQLYAAWAGRHKLAPKDLSAPEILSADHTLSETGHEPTFTGGAKIGPAIENLHSLWQQAEAEIKDLRG